MNVLTKLRVIVRNALLQGKRHAVSIFRRNLRSSADMDCIPLRKNFCDRRDWRTTQTPLSFGLATASFKGAGIGKLRFTFLGGMGLMNHFAYRSPN
jgi:hypothetical protein